MVADRAVLRDRLGEADLLPHVELFDPGRYLVQASIGENIVFGMPVDPSFAAAPLAENPVFLDVLVQSGLREPLDALGLQIASKFDEMLASVSAESPLFDAIGAMTPERMAQLREILDRAADGTGSLDTGDRRELLKLALDYTEARDRFGLLDAELRTRILDARRSFRSVIEAMTLPPVVPHDPAVYNPSLSILDNVLFGLIATRNVSARARVIDAVREVLKAGGHWDAVFDAGLLFQIGSGGRGLSEGQRQKLHLARALIKKPDMLILNRACSVLPKGEQQALLEAVISGFAEDGDAGPGIVCLPSDPDHAVLFDRVVVMEDGHVVADGPPDVVLPARQSPALFANV
jgi:putative ABC transport system ATP-binding protein